MAEFRPRKAGRRQAGSFDFKDFSACDDFWNGIEDPQFETDAVGVAPKPLSAETPIDETQDWSMSFRSDPFPNPKCDQTRATTAELWTIVQ